MYPGLEKPFWSGFMPTGSLRDVVLTSFEPKALMKAKEWNLT